MAWEKTSGADVAWAPDPITDEVWVVALAAQDQWGGPLLDERSRPILTEDHRRIGVG